MRRSSFFIVLTVLALAGCNTMFQKTYQKISVHTPGVENVDCVLENDFTKYHMLAPGRIEVDRSRHPLTITCEKPGFLIAVNTLESKIYASPGNLNLFNGIILGVGYDFASNSVYDYPDSVSIRMRRDPNRLTLQPKTVEVLQKKPEEPKVVPLTEDDKEETEELFRKSLRK